MDNTTFQEVFDAFFGYITDDMYVEITEEETRADCESLLRRSLPLFEFPKASLKYRDDSFLRELSLEEINILATGMVQIWLQRQIDSIELVRQKMSGQDFRLTSQSSHLQRCLTSLEATKAEHRRLQMLYSRRTEDENGNVTSTFGMLITPRRNRQRR